jgi:hypothetical protein
MVRRWILVLIAGLVLVAGCGGGAEHASDESAAARADELEDRPFSGTPGETDSGGSGTSEVADLASAELVDSSRKVVSSADIRVEVDDIAKTVGEAAGITEGVGGIVFGEATSYEKDPEAVLTLKVPPEAFRSVMDRLSGLGEPLSVEVSTEDVTERVVDLESRISTAQASVVRLRGLLDAAGTIDQIALVEGELLVRETDLETLQGQLRTLQDRIDLATIVVTFVEPDHPKASEATPLPGFLDGLQGGWQAFVNIGTITLAALGAALPFLALIVGLVLVWRLTRRRVSAAGRASG